MLKRSLMPIIFSVLAISRITSAEQMMIDTSADQTMIDVLANSSSDSQQPPKKENSYEKQSCSDVKTMRVAARHIEAGGIGYNQGYTTVEGFFAPSPSSWDCMPFLDLRGHVFNDGRLAANAGLGARLMRNCRIYGLNAYYDYRKTKRQHYNQFALGLETLGDVWDFRINGYLPVGDKKSAPYHLSFDRFSGNQIILSEKFEFTMKGADAEMGMHFGRKSNWDFWAAAGPYYFIGDLGGPRWGAKGRVGATFREWITVEFLNSWDRTFHYRPQGQIAIAWPFGPKAKMKRSGNCPCPLSLRMVQPVNRQEIVVVGKATQDTVAINPATGLPFFVVFVDNTSSSSGTFESPYSSLAQAQSNSLPGDIIYVFPGNGATTGMNAGMVLQTNQKFWGSGISHNLVTTLGSVTISQQSATAPLITNTAGSAITLASGNDVSGFSITKPNLHGITGSNVTDVSIANMWIFGAQANVGGGRGISIVENNGITNTLTLQDLFITNNANEGIYIETDGTSSANLFLSNNTATLNGIATLNAAAIALNAKMTSNMNATLQNNSIPFNFGPAVSLDSASSGVLNYHLENNRIGQSDADGLVGNFTGNSDVNITLLGNSVSGSGGSSFSFIGPAMLTAKNNQFDENVNGPGLLITAGNSPFTAVLEDNSLSKNLGNGLTYDTNGTENITFVLHNNEISYNCEGAVEINSVAGMQLDVEMLNNKINSNTANGVTIGSNLASLSAVVNGNEIIGNGGVNALIFADGSVTTGLNLTLNDNYISGNCGVGVQVQPSSVPSCILTLNNNIINANLDNPFVLNTRQGNALITVTGNKITNHPHSMIINAEPTGTNDTAFLFENNEIFTSNINPGDTVDGMRFQYSGTNTGTNSFRTVNNRITSARRGIFLSLSGGANGGSMDIDISDNTSAFNSEYGIDIVADIGNPFTVNTTLFNNTVNNNNEYGIRIQSKSSSIMNADVENNTLFNNNPFGTSDMFVGTNTGNPSLCLQMNNNTSTAGYALTNTAGTFNLAPNGVAGAQAVNSGTITPTGTITSVPSCP